MRTPDLSVAGIALSLWAAAAPVAGKKKALHQSRDETGAGLV
jgi:hypothetical protein